MTNTERTPALGGGDRAAGVNPDHAPKLLEGEAVAWRMLDRNGKFLSMQPVPYHVGFADMMATDCGATVQPLYAHPAPIEAGLREKVEVAGQAAEQRFRGSGLSTAFLAGAQAMKTAILSALQSEGVGG